MPKLCFSKDRTCSLWLLKEINKSNQTEVLFPNVSQLLCDQNCFLPVVLFHVCTLCFGVCVCVSVLVFTLRIRSDAMVSQGNRSRRTEVLETGEWELAFSPLLILYCLESLTHPLPEILWIHYCIVPWNISGLHLAWLVV